MGSFWCVVTGLVVDLEPLRVNGVIPDPADTELLISSTFPGERKEAFKDRSLLGTVGKPEDMAGAYFYLMKDNFIRGSMTHTDGGYLLKEK
jgi:NAD(P)-dependent dehydrogenase (short-subunit alcohol dehydrogenase family)